MELRHGNCGTRGGQYWPNNIRPALVPRERNTSEAVVLSLSTTPERKESGVKLVVHTYFVSAQQGG